MGRIISLKSILEVLGVSVIITGIIVIVSLSVVFSSKLYEEEQKTSVLNSKISALNVIIKNNEKELTDYRTRLKDDLELGRFVLSLMSEVKTDLSSTMKQIVAQAVVRVANNIFIEKQHKFHFAVMLAMESKFDNKAKSSVGATGIAQIMPKFADSFAKSCGIDDYSNNDLNDLEVNLTIGACQFNALLLNKNINGNVAAALVAYNAGINSVSFRSLVGLKNMEHVEPANYVARFTFLSSKMENLIKESEDKEKENVQP